jgi:hypothetical protein
MASSLSRIKAPSSLAKTSAGLKARQSYADRVAKALKLRASQKTRLRNFMAVVPAATFRKWYLQADVPTREKMLKVTALKFEANMGNVESLKTQVNPETLKKVDLQAYKFYFGRGTKTTAKQARSQRPKPRSQRRKTTAPKPPPSQTRTQMPKKPTSLKAMYSAKKSKKTKVYPFYIVGPTIKTIPGVKAKSFTKRSLGEQKKICLWLNDSSVGKQFRGGDAKASTKVSCAKKVGRRVKPAAAKSRKSKSKKRTQTVAVAQQVVITQQVSKVTAPKKHSLSKSQLAKRAAKAKRAFKAAERKVKAGKKLKSTKSSLKRASKIRSILKAHPEYAVSYNGTKVMSQSNVKGVRGPGMRFVQRDAFVALYTGLGKSTTAKKPSFRKI